MDALISEQNQELVASEQILSNTRKEICSTNLKLKSAQEQLSDAETKLCLIEEKINSVEHVYVTNTSDCQIYPTLKITKLEHTVI